MKTRLLQSALLFSILALSLTSCLKDQCEREITYIQVTPVYMTKDAIRLGGLTNEAPRNLEEPGQIYYYHNHLFVNERNEGIHVIDNSDPHNPVNIAFLDIPGNEDLAIKDGILYANAFMDLLAIDITDFQNARVLGREEDVFRPQWEDISTGEILVGYEEEEITEVLDCDTYSGLYHHGGFHYQWGFDRFSSTAEFSLDNVVSPSLAGGANQAAVGGVGIGGSMARFTIIGDYLYTIDENDMDVISLAQAANPEYLSTINLGWGIETIFPYKNNLFIGSETGMFIYDNSNPEQPALIGTFEHARACDPVYVKDDYAYVTLRDGNTCAGFVNQLDVIDITDLTNPILEESFPMDNPHGLTIRENLLTLCEGRFGIKLFDITDPTRLGENQLASAEGLNAWDVISLPSQENISMVIGEDGFFQFKYDQGDGLKLISTIPVNRK